MKEHTYNSTVAIAQCIRAARAQTFSNLPVFLEAFFLAFTASTFVSMVFLKFCLEYQVLCYLLMILFLEMFFWMVPYVL